MQSRWACFVIASALTSAGCGTGAASSAAVPHVELDPRAELLPARTRRLTNWEVERSIRALTGLSVSLDSELPPDVRQEGYTPNVNQDVSSAWASRYETLVTELARRAAHASLVGCDDLAEPTCRERTVRELGLRAFRRPLSNEETQAFSQLLRETEANGDGIEAAAALLLRALLESPSFLYVSELGETSVPGARVRLGEYEIASELSFMLRGTPPDATLLHAAEHGHLSTPEQRVQQARRLLAMPDTRYQFRRFALEWLEVDGLLQTAKSSRLFPSYDALKPFMLAETESYVDEVLVNGGASVQALLAGGFASVGPEMARFYGLHGYGPRASLRGTGRLGVLQQASFLAAHAHEDVTSPVKRGDFVMRKLLCEKVKRPAEIGLEVVMPPPSATLTNRQRLSQHISDPGCASCHTRLDAIGFTFEGFDANGGAQTLDHGKSIDARSTAQLGADPRQLTQLDSSESLTRALLENPTISECFARHAFRYFSAQADPRVEASFLGLRAQLPDEQRDNLFNVLLAYVASDLFVLRTVKPG